MKLSNIIFYISAKLQYCLANIPDVIITNLSCRYFSNRSSLLMELSKIHSANPPIDIIIVDNLDFFASNPKVKFTHRSQSAFYMLHSHIKIYTYTVAETFYKYCRTFRSQSTLKDFERSCVVTHVMFISPILWRIVLNSCLQFQNLIKGPPQMGVFRSVLSSIKGSMSCHVKWLHVNKIPVSFTYARCSTAIKFKYCFLL